MKKVLWSKLLIAIACLSSVSALADDIRLGAPGYGGTGCPSGSASVTLSPDQKALSVLFDSYQAEAGNTTGRMVDRKTCNLAIPVHVPQGFSVSIFQVDYRGFNALPQGARSQFNVEYFFNSGAGGSGHGVRQTKNFIGPVSQDYLLTDKLAANALIWSPCGSDLNLRVNTSMTTFSNAAMEQAMSTVDSADVSAALVYWISWRRCQ